MSMTTIEESGLSFGPYQETHCFYVEKSATYSAVQHGVPMAEFLFLQPRGNRPHRVWVVEAKASSPRSGEPVRFNQFIDEIRQKLTNGLTLGVAARLQRHAAAHAELSLDFKGLDLGTAEFRLVLVIGGHPTSWLPELQSALSKALHATVRTWALGGMAVAVLNEELAQKYGLIR